MGYKGFTFYAFAFRLSFRVFFIHIRKGDVSFSIPEQVKRGSVIGNIAKDLRLDVKRLSARKYPLEDDATKHYCDVTLNSGDLVVTELIDR